MDSFLTSSNLFWRLARAVSGYAKILRVYEAVRPELEPGDKAGEFATAVMQKLGIEVSALGAENLQDLKGPLLFIANHPFGVLDALGLMQVMKWKTPDFRFIANQEVGRVSELREALIPMQIKDHLPMQGANAVQLRKTLGFLRSGGVVGVFPAGEVAAFNSLRSSRTTEKVWSSHVARLAVASRATIVPVYFPG
ncbi:MAG: 1-acyl-sn-glycerol-3-phosphate acyltransferase, partial [Cryobacterium sp.]|nr:1-acyl-sn-glycerol-3-phosphate acyltransferase [Oligoflexia bacterium]